MSRFALVYAILLAVSALAQKRVCDENPRTLTFGGCPNTCRQLTRRQFGPAFLRCRNRVDMGCIMKPCGPEDDPLSSFSCATNQRFLPRQEVCSGDTLVFDEVNVTDRFRFRYNITLPASGSITSQGPGIPTSGPVDFYLLSDVTGSMTNAIAAVRSGFLSLVDLFSRTNPDTRFGLGFYRDETELGGDGFENVRTITRNLTSIRVAISRLRAMGGGDGPEANLVALYRVATLDRIGWRNESTKILAYFGDWPGHEPTCVRGLPELTRNIVADALVRRGVTVVAVSFPPPGLDSNAPTVFRCGSRARAGPGQATVITRLTGGALVQAGDQDRVIFSIQRALREISRPQVTVDESECQTAVLSRHDPQLPAEVGPDGTLTVTNYLRLKRRVCATDRMGLRNFQCRYKYGDSVINISFKRIRGCPS